MTTVFRKVNASVLALLGLAALASAAAPKPVVESAILFAKDKQRLVELSAELNGSKQLFLVVAEMDGNACDWSNWIEPEVVLMDGTVVDLTKLKWKEAQSLGTTRIGKNYDGDDAYRLAFQQWVNQLWEDKDAELERLHQQFPPTAQR